MRNLTHFILGSTALLCSTILFSLGFIIPNITNAQTGPMAPGYEILPKHLQADAETPLVLSSVASPKFCLAMPTEDIDSKTLIVWPCGTAWFQKIWFDKMTAIKAKAKDKVRLRVGTLGCLVSKQKIGASANFAICGDFPKDEVWSMSGGQLRDNSGLCLTLAEAKDGVPPLMQKCEASSDNQQWRLESMRAASKRHPPANKDSSGLGEYHYLGYLPEIVEEFRPRFTQRELTDEEKAELKKIVSTWSDYDPIEELAHKFSTPPFNIKWKTLLRLSELGKNGNKKAMRAIMEAFALVACRP